MRFAWTAAFLACFTAQASASEDDLATLCRTHFNDVTRIQARGMDELVAPNPPEENVRDRTGFRRELNLTPGSETDTLLSTRVTAIERLPDGVVVGRDDRELGGGLYFVRRGGDAIALDTRNVAGIVHAGGQVIAVIRDAEFAADNGALVWIELSGEMPRLGQSVALPGAPRYFAVRGDKVLLWGTRDEWVRVYDPVTGRLWQGAISYPCERLR